MNSGITPETSEGKRTHERINLKTGVVLKTEDGDQIRGETGNVSRGGVLVHSQDKLDNLILGSHLKLYLITDNKRSSAFSCRVTRISYCAIGLELDRTIAMLFWDVINRRQAQT